MTGNLMGQSISQLRRWRKGQPVDHRQLNEPVDVLNDMTRGVGVPRQVLVRVGGAAVVAPSQRVLLATDAGQTDDYLVCRAIGSDVEEFIPILVAKPWLLRKTPWDGQTRGAVRYEYDTGDSTQRTAFRTADAPGSPEAERNKRTELISPQYLIRDELIVVALDTGLFVGDTPVSLIDITGARDWTVIYEQL